MKINKEQKYLSKQISKLKIIENGFKILNFME